MKMSFIIPALNEAAYIGKCLKTVIREIRFSGLDAEIVVVDNGSDDDTAKIASRFSGVKVVHEPIRGLSAARHRGYLESSGELIANLDADNKMPRGWARKVIREFRKDRSMVCLSGPFIYYDVPQINRIVISLYYCFVYVYNLLSQFVFKAGAVAQGGNFTVRRSALDRIGGYDTSIEFYGEDADVASRLSKVGIVKFSLGLPMPSSGRRLLKEGVWRSGFVYALNTIFRIFYGKLLTDTHTDIRES